MSKIPALASITGLCLGMAAPAAEAVTIEFAPASQTVLLGTPADVDIVVSGLAELSAPSLGGFDLDVSFDDGVLALADVRFGDLLGDVGAFEASAGNVLIPGGVELFELSFLLPPALDALQPAAFTLATLSFDTVGVGTSPMIFSRAELVDGLGALLPAGVTSGSLRVAAASVPEPTAFLLVVPGLVGVWWGRRGRARGLHRGPRAR